MKTKVRPKFNPDCQANKPDVAYLCDGYGCEKQCATMRSEEWAKYQCHHTFDENHAVNKIRRNRKFKCEIDHDGVVRGYTEVGK